MAERILSEVGNPSELGIPQDPQLPPFDHEAAHQMASLLRPRKPLQFDPVAARKAAQLLNPESDTELPDIQP
ncbi:MAG: hypothetical protein Greene041662_905 [Candidatus Peregrinibacteria bacterium Greene0416_62]|nr:MAG: hypothetical protein Greene041662_905 [Candidatus Peregrinibacteria bacterium Greene0416_62]TSC99006.1 MAG: hypothetical protein Greene101449_755 [Candidatus Peregrinibacteria bacterium Greene1014_49]